MPFDSTPQYDLENSKADRLRYLADFLETQIRDDQFDIDIWEYEAKCGTVCCAIGWTRYISAFKALGLSSVANLDGHVDPGPHAVPDYTPEGQDTAIFFGVDKMPFSDLPFFRDYFREYDGYADRHNVAAEIRKLADKVEAREMVAA